MILPPASKVEPIGIPPSEAPSCASAIAASRPSSSAAEARSATDFLPDVREIPLDRAVITHEVARHEPEDRIVDLPVLGNAQCRLAGTGGNELVGPRAAEWERLVVDSRDNAAVWLPGLEDEGDRPLIAHFAPSCPAVRRGN